jgi:hypothetical protein
VLQFITDLRFIPDSWVDGLARPFLLADPAAYLYFESHAPDARFAALSLLLLVLTLTYRGRSMLDGPQWRLLLGLTATFYLWTFVSGNGRYFLWGLLLAGPLVVVAVRRLPATRAMRNTVIVGLLALQGWAVSLTFEPNSWALRPWGRGPGLGLADNPLKREPAVFVTIGTISHSILVPQMHPQSRWTNAAGQQDLVPGMLEYSRFQDLLASPLPKYAVVRATRLVMNDERQPIEHAWAVVRRALGRAGLEPAPGRCLFLRADIAGLPYKIVTDQLLDSGFWFCPIERRGPAPADSIEAAYAPEIDDVFAQIEARCPRFFPARTALSRPVDDGVGRAYIRSDTTVFVNHAGAVYFKNMRSLNPTVLGTTADVRAGRFMIDCQRLPGRYLPPWARHDAP